MEDEEEFDPELICEESYTIEKRGAKAKKDRKKKEAEKKEDDDDDDIGMLSMKELMQQMGVARNTVIRLIRTSKFPKPVRIGKSLRWFRKDIVAWLNKRKQQL